MLFVCFNNVFVNGQNIQPIERSVGKLRVSIDPRMELLTAVQLSSNYPFINRGTDYSKDAIKFFESFSSHEAAKMTDNLQQKYGFSYDAPPNFMMHISQPTELMLQIGLSDYLLKRSGGGDHLEQYRKSIKQFVEESNFETFWNNKIQFYNQILDLTIVEAGEIDFIRQLEAYYNNTQKSFNLIIAPAFGGGFGARIPDAEENYDLYAFVSPTHTKEGIPYLDQFNFLGMCWHEFGHSFVNPLTEQYAESVASLNKLYEPIKEKMTKQAYPTWETCINEHIVRAVVIRLVDLNFGSTPSKSLTDYELSISYIYMEPILEKLKEFEKKRDENGITFSDFYPELLNALGNLQP